MRRSRPVRRPHGTNVTRGTNAYGGTRAQTLVDACRRLGGSVDECAAEPCLRAQIPSRYPTRRPGLQPLLERTLAPAPDLRLDAAASALPPSSLPELPLTGRSATHNSNGGFSLSWAASRPPIFVALHRLRLRHLQPSLRRALEGTCSSHERAMNESAITRWPLACYRIMGAGGVQCEGRASCRTRRDTHEKPLLGCCSRGGGAVGDRACAARASDADRFRTRSRDRRHRLD